MDAKNTYVFDVLIKCGEQLINEPIKYDINQAIGSGGQEMITFHPGKGENAYSYIQKNFLNEILECYDSDTPIPSCCELICNKIDIDDFNEKIGDPFYAMRG